MKKATRILSEAEKEMIAKTIKTAEEKTACEIIPVLARRSDHYEHASYMVGFIVALLSYCFANIFFPEAEKGSWAGFQGMQYSLFMIAIMICGFTIGCLVSRFFPSLKLFFISKREMKLRVKRTALDAYMQFCQGKTKENTGIVILVSLYERMVYIQGDSSVSVHFKQKDWNTICQAMINELKKGSLVKAFKEGIEITGKFVCHKLPIQADDDNEIVNELYFI